MTVTDLARTATTTGMSSPVDARRPRTVRERLASVDHKDIGVRYMVTAFVFFVLAGLESMVMRAQLAGPDGSVVGTQTYDELFTMHGVTMIFLFITPMFSGFGNYLIPLMIGARDMAFPRLNALSYWVYLFSGLFLYSSVVAGAVPGRRSRRVPLCASSARPIAAVPCAPVRARPNSSGSRSDEAMAPQSTTTSGRSARRLRAWMVWATSSLPVPASPSMTAGASLGAMASIRSYRAVIAGSAPTRPP